MAKLTHIDDRGRARMVDISEKAVTERIAVARGSVYMNPETLAAIESGSMKKGDVVAVARVAGIMAAKRTSDLIPLCHPLPIATVEIDITLDEDRNAVDIQATAKTSGRTGVEMEALTAVSVSALTVYDMCKAMDRGIRIGDICLEHKSGGKSGTYNRP